MNKRLSAILLAVATSAFLAIGCGSTATYSETEVIWATGDFAESEEIAEPGLEAELLESEAPWVVETKPVETNKQP